METLELALRDYFKRTGKDSLFLDCFRTDYSFETFTYIDLEEDTLKVRYYSLEDSSGCSCCQEAVDHIEPLKEKLEDMEATDKEDLIKVIFNILDKELNS